MLPAPGSLPKLCCVRLRNKEDGVWSPSIFLPQEARVHRRDWPTAWCEQYLLDTTADDINRWDINPSSGAFGYRPSRFSIVISGTDDIRVIASANQVLTPM